MIEKMASIALESIEASKAGLTKRQLGQQTGLSGKELTKTLESLSRLNLIRASTEDIDDVVWVDQSKFNEQKKIPFNPSLLELSPGKGSEPSCLLLAEHKNQIVRAISSIPFFFYPKESNDTAENLNRTFAYNRAFEKVIHKGISQFERKSTFGFSSEGSTILSPRRTFDAILSDYNKNLFSVKQLSKLNALFSFEEDKVSGCIRSKPVFIEDSLYAPLSTQSALELFTSKLLQTASRIESSLDRSFYLSTNLMYLQPFVDANKRTATLAANINLLNSGLAPFAPNLQSKESFLNAFLDYCEYGEVEAMSSFFCRSLIKSTHEFEQLFEINLDALNNTSPAEIRSISKSIVADALGNYQNPHALLSEKLKEISLSQESTIANFFTSEIDSVLFCLENLNESDQSDPQLNALMPLYREFKREKLFDSEMAIGGAFTP